VHLTACLYFAFCDVNRSGYSHGLYSVIYVGPTVPVGLLVFTKQSVSLFHVLISEHLLSIDVLFPVIQTLCCVLIGLLYMYVRWLSIIQ